MAKEKDSISGKENLPEKDQIVSKEKPFQKEQTLVVPERVFTRRIFRQAKYAVVPVEKLRAINAKDDAEVVEDAKAVTDDMIKSLEEMVNAAKAGKLEGENVLALAAVVWN